MKLSIVFLFLTFPLFAQADQAPSWWQLPNQGKNCTFVARFEEGKGCRAKAYETWNCTIPSNDAFTPASSRKYLIVGEYVSDSGPNAPCTTFVVKKTIPQN